MNKKGFTLVEIIAVVALIAIISVAAILGVNSMINRQRIKTATLSEKNIAEAALTVQTEKHKLYLPACVDKTTGNYVNISEMIIKKINDDLRDQMAHDGKTTIVQKEQYVKDFVKNINNDELFKKNFSNDYLEVKDINCFKATSVADMIKEGSLKDLDNGCDTASLIIVYNKGDSTNTAGNLKAVQETGICKGSFSEEKGPLITVNPEKDLRSTATKNIKITATANESKLESNLVLKYGWSKSLRNKPNDWETVNLVGNQNKVSAEVSKTGADEDYYLWIFAGSVKDNQGYSNSTFATGPYSFLPTPSVRYSSLNEDPTFPLRGGKRCDTETTCNNKTKAVVYSKPYGKNLKGYTEPLCTPVCRGYTFNTWRYNDLDINNNSIVGERNNHTLIAKYTANKYTVSYNSNTGSACSPDNKTVTFDEPYGPLCTPSKNGYTYKGWWTTLSSGTQITSTTYVSTTSDHIIYAHWEANPFYVAYNGNGATGGSVATHQCTYDKDCLLKNNEFVRNNFTFNGWKKDNTGNALKEGTNIKNATAIRDATLTYYAQWCNNCITPANGTCTLNVSTPGTCKYTTTCKGGYSIANNGKYNPICIPTTYSITYNLNGGTVSPANPTTYTSETAKFTLRNPTRTGYTFEGWSGTGISGKSKTVTIDKGSTGNRSYTANWKVITYSITYKLNGGTVSGNPTSYNITTNTFTLKNPRRTGYAFLGWSGTGLSGTGNKTVRINKGSTGNRSYSANWGKLPTCTIAASRGAYRGEWYKEDVGITMTTYNATSYGLGTTAGIFNNSKYYNVTTEGNIIYYGSVKNSNGTGSCSITIKLDKTPPIIIQMDQNYGTHNGVETMRNYLLNHNRNPKKYVYYNTVWLVWQDPLSGTPLDKEKYMWFRWPKSTISKKKVKYGTSPSGLVGKKGYTPGYTGYVPESLGYAYKDIKEPVYFNVTYHLCDYVDNCVENTVSYKGIR